MVSESILKQRLELERTTIHEVPMLRAVIQLLSPLAIATACLAPGIAAAADVDGFDYPVGDRAFGYATEAHDGDGYYNAQDFTVSDYAGGHCGEDWNGEGGGDTDYGDAIYAVANGVVTHASDGGSGWGDVVTIEHAVTGASDADYETMVSQYAHLSAIDVSVGDTVSRSDKIGEMGDVGGLYATHLHFELRWDETLSAGGTGYGCYDTSSGRVDPSDFFDTHRTWGGSSIGDPDYCSTSAPCGPGEGDCDSDSECDSGLSCVPDTGRYHGLAYAVDICQPSCHAGPVGGPDYCAPGCPCHEAEGHCYNDFECAAGLICVEQVGYHHGWPAGVNVCQEDCHRGDLGERYYCSTSCPCGAGEGDCDSDSECDSGLTCEENVGASYGYHSNTDVCE